MIILWIKLISVTANSLRVFAYAVFFADSLRYTSALSFALAVIFLVIAVGISIFKIAVGGIGMPRLFPIITDVSSVFELFTVTPVVVTAYLCHFNGVKVSQTFLWNSLPLF